MTKYFVYSARTTEAGLALLNKTKDELNLGWDKFISQAVAEKYGLNIEDIALPVSDAMAERAKQKAIKDKEKAEKKAANATKKAEKLATKAKEAADKAEKAAADALAVTPKEEEPPAEEPAPKKAKKGKKTPTEQITEQEAI